MTDPRDNEGAADPAELQKFGDALARPAIRKAFKQDPLAALDRAGVDLTKIPPGIVDLVADLSDDELDVLGRVAERARLLPDVQALRDHVGVIIH